MQCSVNAMVTVVCKEKVGGQCSSLRPVLLLAPARNGEEGCSMLLGLRQRDDTG